MSNAKQSIEFARNFENNSKDFLSYPNKETDQSYKFRSSENDDRDNNNNKTLFDRMILDYSTSNSSNQSNESEFTVTSDNQSYNDTNIFVDKPPIEIYSNKNNDMISNYNNRQLNIELLNKYEFHSNNEDCNNDSFHKIILQPSKTDSELRSIYFKHRDNINFNGETIYKARDNFENNKLPLSHTSLSYQALETINSDADIQTSQRKMHSLFNSHNSNIYSKSNFIDDVVGFNTNMCPNKAFDLPDLTNVDSIEFESNSDIKSSRNNLEKQNYKDYSQSHSINLINHYNTFDHALSNNRANQMHTHPFKIHKNDDLKRNMSFNSHFDENNYTNNRNDSENINDFHKISYVEDNKKSCKSTRVNKNIHKMKNNNNYLHNMNIFHHDSNSNINDQVSSSNATSNNKLILNTKKSNNISNSNNNYYSNNILPNKTARKSSMKSSDGTNIYQTVWDNELEEAFMEAITLFPPFGRKRIPHPETGKVCGRNELISEYILSKTGVTRSTKQISSHIQVMKRRSDYINCISDD